MARLARHEHSIQTLTVCGLSTDSNGIEFDACQQGRGHSIPERDRFP